MKELKKCYGSLTEQNPVELLRWSFFSKIVNSSKLLTFFAQKLHRRYLTEFKRRKQNLNLLFYDESNTWEAGNESIKSWFSSGHGRKYRSQRIIFQSRTNLLCWLPNICSWRYLWRICQESYRTSSEENSWRPFWQCYNAGTPGETLKCLGIKLCKSHQTIKLPIYED